MASALTTTSASGANSRIIGALRQSTSAVPVGNPPRSSWPIRGCRMISPPDVRSRSHGRPLARWSLSEIGLNCCAIHTSDRPALRQFESGKSISRWVPANDTAGLARSCVSSSRRPPAPPARTTTKVLTRLFIDSSSGRGYPAASPHTRAIAARAGHADEQLAGRDGLSAQIERALPQVGGQVVVIALEVPARDAEPLSERMQLF